MFFVVVVFSLPKTPHFLLPSCHLNYRCLCDCPSQILEKLLEREREELRKEKDEHRTEKAKRQKTERTIMDTIRNVNQVIQIFFIE